MQAAGLTIHALDRIDVQRLAQARDLAVRVVGLYRTVVLTDAGAARAQVLAELHRGPGLPAELSDAPPVADLPEMPRGEQRLFRVNMNLVAMPPPQRWRELQIARRAGLAPRRHRPATAGRPVAEREGAESSRRGPGTRRPSWPRSC